MRALADHRRSEAFSDLEKAALDYAAALTRTPADVGDALYEELQAGLREDQLVELTAVIAWENWRARFNRGFDVGPQGFSEGGFCALPERSGRGGEPLSRT